MNIFNYEETGFLTQSLIIQGYVNGIPRPAIVWKHPRGQTLVDDGANVHTQYDEDGRIQLQVLLREKQKRQRERERNHSCLAS